MNQNLKPLSSPVVVHFVHGTWPYGPFKTASGVTKAWFEEGSPVRAGLLPTGDSEPDVRVFKWSGRNSAEARGRAAGEFLRHLESALDERQDTRHVIVAHSHGGTVAAHALSMAEIHETATPRVKALICMATPFAYISDARSKTESNVLNSLANAIFASVWLFVVAYGAAPHGLKALWAIPISSISMLILRMTILDNRRLMFIHGRHAYRGQPIPPNIPTFLMRATRDEAALVLSVAQAIQAIAVTIFDILDVGFIKWRNFWRAAILTTPVFACSAVLLAFVLDRTQQAWPDPWSAVITLAILTGGLSFLPLFAGRFIMAVASGDWRLLDWAHTFVEIDAAPPDSPCQFKSYSNFDETSSRFTQRHGIYELGTLQTEIKRLIMAVAHGESPRLLKAFELDNEKVLSAHFVRQPDPRWEDMPPDAPGSINDGK